MSVRSPQAGCRDLALPSLRLDDLGEVALEDYAQALLEGAAATAVRDATGVIAIHVCGVERAIGEDVRCDLEAFAASLAVSGDGLGWA